MRLQWSVGKEMTPETAVKKSIRDYLKLSGWFTFSIMQGLGSYRGIADIYAIKNGNGLWIEVKAGKGKQSDYQIRFEKDIKDKGGHYILAYQVEDIEKYVVENFGEKSLLNYN